MAFDTRQMPLLRPSAVTIHDNGDMAGQRSLGFGAEVSGLRTHRI
jgi:hypothetical protein